MLSNGCQVFPPLYAILQCISGDEHPFVLGVRLFPPAVRFYIEKLFFFMFIWGMALLEGPVPMWIDGATCD